MYNRNACGRKQKKQITKIVPYWQWKVPSTYHYSSKPIGLFVQQEIRHLPEKGTGPLLHCAREQDKRAHCLVMGVWLLAQDTSNW